MDDAVRITRESSAWLSPLSYWFPEHIVASAWTGHAPFAAWLIGAHRPRTLVELGTHDGYSYFAFVEFARRLGIPLESWAIDTWVGDDHAGRYGEEVYDLVDRVNAQYSPTSHLVRSLFADAVTGFEDGTIDLLHIDGRHGYEDVREDFETYLPKVSDRGIVLFHDIDARDRGFGVYRLWDEVATQYPSFAFHHSSALGVLLVGENQTPEVRAFHAAASTAADRVRDDYERHGGRIFGIQIHSRMLNEANEKIDELREEVAARDRELTELRSSTSWRITSPLRRLRGI